MERAIETGTRKKNLSVFHKTVKEIFSDINKDKKEGEKKAVQSTIPRKILWLLALATFVATVLSAAAAIIGGNYPVLYGTTLILWSMSLCIGINAIINPVKRPEEWIISFVGEFYDIATPGPYPLIPFLIEVVSRVKVNTSQPLELFREEMKPVIFADGVHAKPKIVVVINIKDPYAVTYGISVHDSFVAERQKIGVFYDKNHNYFYGLEEILDSLIRTIFSSLNIEQVLQMNTITTPTSGAKFEVNPELSKAMEVAADEVLKQYGVDVEIITIPEIEIVEKDVSEKLQEKFKQKQDEEIAKLQEKVEKAKVNVEIQKAFQEEQKGIGAGKLLRSQIDKLVEGEALTPLEAATFLATLKWANAAEKGNVSIIATAEGGNVQMPVMTGFGIGMGQKAAEKQKKEPMKEASVSETDKSKPKTESKRKRGEK